MRRDEMYVGFAIVLEKQLNRLENEQFLIEIENE